MVFLHYLYLNLPIDQRHNCQDFQGHAIAIAVYEKFYYTPPGGWTFDNP